MMKRITLALGCLVLLASLASTARADAISFSFIFRTGGGGFTANQVTGLTGGPGVTLIVSDVNTGQHFTVDGLASFASGPTTSWTVVPGTPAVLISHFGPGGSISVTDSTGLIPWVTGTTVSSDFLALLGTDTGSGDGSIMVTYVDPTILAMFGLGSAFQPTGAYSFNTSHNDMTTSLGVQTVTSNLAGGLITVFTPVPEPGTLALLGTGVLGLAGAIRRRVL